MITLVSDLWDHLIFFACLLPFLSLLPFIVNTDIISNLDVDFQVRHKLGKPEKVNPANSWIFKFAMKVQLFKDDNKTIALYG